MKKKEYEVPQLDIVKFSMETDIMTSGDENVDTQLYPPTP